jgi:hypothetical protein
MIAKIFIYKVHNFYIKNLHNKYESKIFNWFTFLEKIFLFVFRNTKRKIFNKLNMSIKMLS